jgi:AmmeMemoRadiSam system protein A
MTNSLVTLAKKSVEHSVKAGRRAELPSGLPEKMVQKRAGVFVSIHTKKGQLRGCIGTFLPTKKNVAEEIIANAVAAAQDPRFPPLTEAELPDLVYKVDVLSKLKPAKKENLDPKKYGLLVTGSDGRRGLLLPDIPGIKTVEDQIHFCKLKAGINPEEKVKFQIFTVKRYK